MRKKSVGRIVFKIVNSAILTVFALICILPFWHVLMSSLSTTEELWNNSGDVFLLWPLCEDGIASIEGYTELLSNDTIWMSIANSLFYIAIGGALTVIFSYCAAYCMKRGGVWSKPFTVMMVLASVFSVGIVPAYAIHKAIGLYHNRWALIMIGLMNIFYAVYVFGAMKQLPQSLEDAAELDGAGAFTVLFKIIFPLTKFSAAAVFLMCAIVRWNDWLMPLIYSVDRNTWPLQLRIYEYSTYVGYDPSCYFTMPDYSGIWHKLQCLCVVSALVSLAVLYPLIHNIIKKNIAVGTIKY